MESRIESKTPRFAEPAQSLPHPRQIIQMMTLLAQRILSTLPVKVENTQQTPKISEFPRSSKFDSYRQYENIFFAKGDFDYDVTRGMSPFPSKAKIKKWLAILHFNLLRPLYHLPNLKFTLIDLVSIYNERFPYLMDTSNSGAVVWGPSTSPAIILNRQMKNFALFTDKRGKTGYPILHTSRHKNRCLCGENIERNNYEFCFFSIICFLHSMFIERSGPMDSIDAESLRILNPSILFFSPIYKEGLYSPRMTNRQPLSMIYRAKSREYKPPFSGIDLLEDFDLLIGLNAYRFGSSFNYFLKHFCEDAGQSTLENHFNGPDMQYYRHPPARKQAKSLDIQARYPSSADWILSNSVHMTPFYGPYHCPYCAEIIQSLTLEDLIQHLATQHLRLRSAVFSCPSCIKISLQRWDTFSDHYRNTHAAANAMLVVLDETDVAQRMALGLALSSLITATNNCTRDFPSEIAACVEAMEFANHRGGYVVANNLSDNELKEKTDTLRNRITLAREGLIPEPIREERRKKRDRSHDNDSGQESDQNEEISSRTYKIVQRRQAYTGAPSQLHDSDQYTPLVQNFDFVSAIRSPAASVVDPNWIPKWNPDNPGPSRRSSFSETSQFDREETEKMLDSQERDMDY